MQVEVLGNVYDVEARGRAKAVAKAVALATGLDERDIQQVGFLKYIRGGVVYVVIVNGTTISATVLQYETS